MSIGPPLLLLKQIVKTFGDTRANDHVDFDLQRGEIHALLGENGAGKTTLMNIVAGLYKPTSGEVVIRGRSVRIRSPRDAIAHGVGMVHQHFQLVDRLTVAENLTLGWHVPRWALRRQRLETEANRIADTFGIHVEPGRPVWQLSVGEQQRVEILKALYREAEILILDEPTPVLTPQEGDQLFASLRRMAEDGRGVVLITHRLDEVMRHADRVTVLRRGRNVGTLAGSAASADHLAQLMIGDALSERVRGTRTAPRETLLRLQGVQALDDRGHRALRGIELEVRAGEIVGIAGVAGNGQAALAEVIAGLRPLSHGRVILCGRDVSNASVRKRFESGLAFCPEDRIRHGVAMDLPILENLVARIYRRAPIGRRVRLDGRAARRRALGLMADFDIRGAPVDAPMHTLSGGNAQKVLLARELSADPRLIVATHPTRGLDVGAADATRRLLVSRRDAGCGVLLISEDLDELMEISDRLIVLAKGRVTGEFPGGEVDAGELGLAMAAG
jgi:simple sugar transport system ATP-binding protein